MKKIIITLTCLSLFSLATFAQGNHRRSAKSHAKAETVTATGCITEGVECLVLEPLNGGGQKYSIVRSKKLKVGTAYRIIGTTSDIGFCQQGIPILAARKITPLKIHCPKTVKSNVNRQ
jgi:hypothetical protein